MRAAPEWSGAPGRGVALTMTPLSPTQQDVARRAGVNKSTVSRVLRGNRDVAAETRRRVLAAAADLGYRLDPALSRIAALRWQKPGRRATQPLAFVERTSMTAHETIWQGVQEQAERLGYCVERLSLADYRNGSSVASVLAARGIQFVVLAGFYDRVSLDGLVLPEGATVHCGCAEPGFPGGVVMVDPLAKLAQIWDAARRRGRTGVGLVLANVDRDHYPHVLLAGFNEMMQRRHRASEVVPTCLLETGDAREAVTQLRRWWAVHLPDLVVLPSEREVRWWREVAVDWPQLPPAVALEGQAGSKDAGCYEQAGRELGAIAVQSLHTHYLSGGGTALNQRVLIPPRWCGPGSLADWICRVGRSAPGAAATRAPR